jgi:pimeloyl-ACP methyl ester carboxylesterase
MFVQNYPPQNIPCGESNGVAYWSVNPIGRAIIFVHGFRGHATGTWQEFPSLLLKTQSFSGYDLIFYTYNTIDTPIADSGSLFEQFLEQLFDKPVALWQQSLPPGAIRSDEVKYQSLIIVAHSLGAVVSRLALVRAYEKNSHWLLKTRLVLFAPAHCGANVQALVMSAATSLPWVGFVMGITNYFCPTVKNLTPGSEILKELLKRTEKAQKDMSETSKKLLAHLIIRGSKDKVVEPLRFSKDPDFITVPNKDHISICKPNRDYTLPVEQLVEVL